MFRWSPLARVFAMVLAVGSAPAGAVEGKWLPEQVPGLDAAQLKKMGLELPLERLWNPTTGTGLLSAAVNLNGCSGAFISATGLVITNHHCVFGIIAEHSSAGRNLLEDGFLARTPAEELPGTTARLRVPVAFTDVTAAIHAVAVDSSGAALDDRALFVATDRKKKELVAACEATPGKRCDVSTFYGGLRHIMMEQVELTDVRLVYAPPRAVGEFGGETDNWMWPRHTGDFAIVRAWVDPNPNPNPNPTAPTTATSATTATTTPPPAVSIAHHVPHRPPFHFPLATSGTRPGDFVMVLGYPGTTVRELLADEMQQRADQVYPWLIRWSDTVIATLEGVTDAEGAIAVAPLLKSQHNRRKNAAGQLEGLARGAIIDKKRQAEADVVALTVSRPAFADAVTARTLLLDELKGRQASFERDALLGQVLSGPRSLSIAVKLARMANERDKPDIERDENYMERERPRVLKELVRDQKAYFAPADKTLLLQFVQAALALPTDQRIKAIDDVFGRAAGAAGPSLLRREQAIRRIIDGLYRQTRVLADASRAPMTLETAQQLRARPDPLLKLAFGINQALDDKKCEDDRREGASLRIRPAWMQAVLAKAGGPVAPDANRTLRVSFGTVQGYRPKDGVTYAPYTTLTGLFAKHTGKEPFAVPQRLQDAAAKGVGPASMAPFLGDVPVNFLADADTTGGNSGSPVVNGRGELVGVNFDRVWENVANDFGYNPDIARNVSVDVRYVLWLLRDVDGAAALLQELGI